MINYHVFLAENQNLQRTFLGMRIEKTIVTKLENLTTPLYLHTTLYILSNLYVNYKLNP